MAQIIKIPIEKDGRTPLEHLTGMGYEDLGSLFDRRNKKYKCFKKDGATFWFRGCDILNDSEVINLQDITDLGLR